MAKPLVLITGASGHIGFATLSLVLKKGYRVRIASRKLSTAQKLKDLPSIKPYRDSISFAEIPDFLAPNAFNEAAKDVDYVLHIASPLPDDNLAGTEFSIEEEYIKPAIQGNIGILKAAQKSPSVKRIVITSSIAILAKKDDGTTAGPDDLAPLPKTEEILRAPWAAYAASKTLANAAADEFVKTQNLHFDVVHILPSYVQGKNEPVTSSRELSERPSSNQTMVNFLRGVKETQPRPLNFVFVDDVAATHVAAMEAKDITSGERFIAAYPELVQWEEVRNVAKRLFPKEFETGLLSADGEQPGWGMNLDPSKTTERFEIRFHGIDDMVRSLVGQYLELVKAESQV